MSHERPRTLMKAFIEPQFRHCPLTRMFCGRVSNNRINYLYERVRSVSLHDRNIPSFEIEI